MREALSLIWTALAGCSGHVLRWQPRSWSSGIRLTYYDGIRRRGRRSAPWTVDLCRAVSISPNGPKRSGDCEAGDRHKMAPCRVQIVLALEVEERWRPTKDTAEDTRADPRDQHCQSSVGSPAGSTESCSSSVLMSDRRAWPNIWSKDENRRRKVGRRSCAIMRMGSLRWIYSSCRQSRSACSTDC